MTGVRGRLVTAGDPVEMVKWWGSTIDCEITPRRRDEEATA